MGLWEVAAENSVHNATILISFAVSIFLYILSDSVYIHIFGDVYTNLSLQKRSDWRTRFASTIHAVLVSALATYALVAETQLRDDPVWGDSWVPKTSCAIVTGYMFSDMFIMLWYYDLLGDVSFLFHHCATIFAYLTVIYFHVFEYCAMWRLIAEYSTPFLNFRIFLDDTNMRASVTYVINGTLFMAFFLASRIFTMPYYYYIVYSMHGTPAFVAAGGFKFVLYVSCLVLDLLNAYWGAKVVKGFFKGLHLYLAAKSDHATMEAPQVQHANKNGSSRNGVAKKVD